MLCKVNQMEIKYPYQFNSLGRTAETGEDDHIRDMIEQFLFTNPGERVNRPDFGSGLLQLVFSPNSPELAAAVQFTVKSGLQLWLGDLIDVQNVEAKSEDAMLSVNVIYSVRRTGEQRTESFARKVG